MSCDFTNLTFSDLVSFCASAVTLYIEIMLIMNTRFYALLLPPFLGLHYVPELPMQLL